MTGDGPPQSHGARGTSTPTRSVCGASWTPAARPGRPPASSSRRCAGLTFGEAAGGHRGYWCPRRGDIVTDAAVNLREPYAGAGTTLQVVGAFDPRRGTGLYLMTQDIEGHLRFYQAQKSGDGARLAVEYTPLHDAELPRTVIGCNQGDWHEQLGRYREWLATWYQPAAPRKDWFQDVFSFRQQFMHFDLPSRSGMFDPETRAIQLKEVVDADAEAFGGVDYLHLFDWGYDPVHGRCGDYEPWDYLGGADNFHRAVEEVKAAGTPWACTWRASWWTRSPTSARPTARHWQMLGPAGKPYTYFAPSYHVCPRVPEWQDYLSDTYRRVREQTGAVGFYIDEYGFSGPTYWCYNPDHGHPVPVTPVVGEREMLQKVRAKLGPGRARSTPRRAPRTSTRSTRTAASPTTSPRRPMTGRRATSTCTASRSRPSRPSRSSAATSRSGLTSRR